MVRENRLTRRRTLGTIGAAVSTVVVAGCGGPGEEGNETEPAGEEEPGEENETGQETDNESDDELESEEGTGNGQDIEEEENETGT
ncbi:hypothetical protein [Halopiger djelfimassiliensis]|uniref:hypothetical protein n=1 Tax=Halopiger djelfimassiliensis TaxID=1293047 RepID=UPI00067816BD|nr:hypothetical protein [Halopiger djelfimassiliensis]